MKRKILLIILLAAILIGGCSPATGTAVKTESAPIVPTPQASHPDAIKRDAFATYTATFSVNFDGTRPWKYQLIIRKAQGLRELQYHVEGVDSQKNLGDIRLVTDGVTNWMTGPGTDNACIQFPVNTGLDPTFIYPENIITMDEQGEVANFVREEPYAGRNSMYYLVGPTEVGGWKDTSVEYHQEKGSEALLQFAMLASGTDEFFGTGSGTIMANYTVDSLDSPAIEPVGGCEISAPLPDSAINFVRMPGLASFDSPQTVQEIVQYYQGQLTQAGWAEVEPPAQSENAVVLSYRREPEVVEIQIEGMHSGGSSVKMFFVQE